MSEPRRFGTELSVNRVFNKKFTPEARAYICGLADAGQSLSQIAEAVGASHRGVVNRIIKRTRKRKTAKTANRRRGKYKTTPRNKKYLILLARRYPDDTYAQLINRSDLPISSKTCKKILQRHHLEQWRKEKRVLLTKKNAQRRLEFARQWSRPGEIQKLITALFSDEYTIQNSPNNPR